LSPSYSFSSALPSLPALHSFPTRRSSDLDPYFVSARAGAEDAGRELGIDLIWDGPTGLDAAKQNELIENWITRHVDAIAVAVEKDRKSTRLNSSHQIISYAVFCLKKKKRR